MLKRLIAGTLSAIISTTAVLPNHLSNVVIHEAKAASQNEDSFSSKYDINSTNLVGNPFNQEIFFEDTGALNKEQVINPDENETVTDVVVTQTVTTQQTFVTQTLPALSFTTNEIISETGSLGENISYTLYSDGYLYVSGYGDMNDFGSSPFRDPSLIKYAVIESTGDEKSGEIITSIGNNVFINCSNMEYVNLPKTIKHIGNNAFRNCSSLSIVSYGEYGNANEKYTEGQLIMPEVVTSVGEYAFANCASITDIVIEGTVSEIKDYAFSDCTSLKKAVIGEGTESIGYHIFSGCSAIEDITIPYIGHSLAEVNEEGSKQEFSDFFLNGNGEDYYEIYNAGNWRRYIPKSLKSITVTGGTRIPNYAFYRIPGVKNITVPSMIKSFGAYSYADCVALENANVPEGAESIGNYAFSNCSSSDFKTVKLPSTLASIGSYAFNGCKGLTNITIPKSVKTIGEYTFNNCSTLETVVIYGGADGIGNHIFSGCKSLADLTLPFAGLNEKTIDDPDTRNELSVLFLNGNGEDYYEIYNAGNWRRYIPKSLKKVTVLSGTRLSDYAFYRFTGVESFVLPNSMTEIGNYSFADCSSITKNNIPEGVKYIGDHAFENCTSLSDGKIPEGVISLGKYAFSNCRSASLKTITLPKTLTAIGNNAFSGCSGLTRVTVPETVKTIGAYAFSDCSSLASAVIKGGADGIGSHVFSGCKSLAELTLPFAGYSLEAANADGSKQELLDLFLNGDAEDYYEIYNTGNWRRYIPKALKEITILGGKQIPKYAFFRMIGVEDFYLPDGVTNIADNSFDGCSVIQNVFYPSTKADWEKNVTVGANNEEIDGKERFFIIDEERDSSMSIISDTTSTTSTIKSTTTSTTIATKNKTTATKTSTTVATKNKTTAIKTSMTVATKNKTTALTTSTTVATKNKTTATKTSANVATKNKTTASTTSTTIATKIKTTTSKIFKTVSTTSMTTTLPKSTTTDISQANRDKIYKYIISDNGLGLSKGVACGILGNIRWESNYDPASINPNDKGTKSYGICQWRDYTDPNTKENRYKNLENYAKAHNKKISDLELQLDFMKVELEKNKYYKYEMLKDLGNSSTDVVHSAEIWEAWYEGCDPKNFKQREDEALSILGNYVSTQTPGIFYDFSDKKNIPSYTLKKGTKSHGVIWLQQILKALGYLDANFTIDGEFDSDTETAVKNFQKAFGLKDANGNYDGEAGRVTKEKLYDEYMKWLNKTTTTTQTVMPIITTTTQPILRVDGELHVKEMTEDEIIKRGIDIRNPDNFNCVQYSIEADFEAAGVVFNRIVQWDEGYEPINYVYLEVDGEKPLLITDRPYVYVDEIHAHVIHEETVDEDMYLIIYGESKWLKEFYDVQLIVTNKGTGTLTDCTAKLNVPNGLTLVDGSVVENIGSLAPNQVATRNWCVRGDKEGDYSLSAVFSGMNGSDPFALTYRSQENLHVYAYDALKMTVEVPSLSYYGRNYPIKITLKNVSDKPVYNLETTIKGKQQGSKATLYFTNLDTDGNLTSLGAITKEQTLYTRRGTHYFPVDLNPHQAVTYTVNVPDVWASVFERYVSSYDFDRNTALILQVLEERPELMNVDGIRSVFEAAVGEMPVEHILKDVIVQFYGSNAIDCEIKIKERTPDQKIPVRRVASNTANQLVSELFFEAYKHADKTTNQYINFTNHYIQYVTTDSPFFINDFDEYINRYNRNLLPFTDELNLILHSHGELPTNIRIEADVIRNFAPFGNSKVKAAASENSFTLADINGTELNEDGSLTVKGDTIIRVSSDQIGASGKLIVDYSDGTTEEIKISNVEKHECKSTSGYTLVAAPKDGKEGLAVRRCDTCGEICDSITVNPKATAMLSNKNTYADVKVAVEEAAQLDTKTELSLFGNITIASDITIPENVDVLIAPDTNITVKNGAKIVAKGKVNDFSGREYNLTGNGPLVATTTTTTNTTTTTSTTTTTTTATSSTTSKATTSTTSTSTTSKPTTTSTTLTSTTTSKPTTTSTTSTSTTTSKPTTTSTTSTSTTSKPTTTSTTSISTTSTTTTTTTATSSTTSKATTTSTSTSTTTSKPTTTSSTSTSTTTSEPTTTSTVTTTVPVVVNYGDLNADGLIDAVDASVVLRQYALVATHQDGIIKEENLAAADVNNDGSVDSVDASIILRYYVYYSTITEPVSLEKFVKNNVIESIEIEADAQSDDEPVTTTTTTAATSAESKATTTTIAVPQTTKID